MTQTVPVFDGFEALLAADVAEVGARLFVGCFGPGGKGSGGAVYRGDLVKRLASLGGFEREVGMRGSSVVSEQTQTVGRECVALWKLALFVDSDPGGRINLLRNGLGGAHGRGALRDGPGSTCRRLPVNDQRLRR